MRLIRLEASDFAQHGSLDIDLSAFAQAVIVGENGAGKSTLMDAVVWCLFGRGTERSKSNDDLIRDDRLAMWVRTTWDLGGREVVITRSRSTETKAGESSLSLHVDGDSLTKHTIGETQAEVERLVGLDRDQLLAGPFMEQGQQDKLMRLDPAKRKALFAALCGADRFEHAHEVVKAWAAEVTVALSRTETKIERVREHVDTELEVMRQRDQASRDRDVSQRAVDQLSDEIETLRAEAESLREQALRAEHLSNQMDALHREDTALAKDIAGLEQSIAGYDSLLASDLEEPEYEVVPERISNEAKIRDLTRHAEAVPVRQDEIRDGEARLAASESAEVEALCDRCPYRGAILPLVEQLKLRDRIKDAKQYVEFYADALVRAERLRSEERERDLRIAGLEESNDRKRQAYELAQRTREQASVIVVDLRAGVTEKQERRAAISEELRTLQSDRLRLVQSDDRAREVADEMTTKADNLNVARRMLTTAESELAVAEDALRRVEAARKELHDLDAEWAVLKTEEEAHALVMRMFHRDGLPTMILEATVPLVESRANEMLERMPGDMTVALVTQKQTKSGSWRDTLDVEVSEGGRERAYGMLSGAERFRVDLALRLGLSSVLLHRSGSKFETLWLDEPFAAQDRRALESLLASVAAVVDEFGLTLVVTHQQEVAERFPTRIEVREAEFGVAGVEVVE